MAGSTSAGNKRCKGGALPPAKVVGNILGGGGRSEAKEIDDNVVTELMTEAIIRHGYPLTYFEEKANRNILTFLNPNVKPFTKDISQGCCSKVYETEKEKLKQELASIPGRLCLTCDVWADACTNEYVCLTVNYVDSNWKLQSKFLSLVALHVPLDVSWLQSEVYDLLCNWGIEKKIFTVTLDSGRCLGTLTDLLMNSLNSVGGLLCNGDYFHVPCGAKFMDNIVKECFKLIKGHISKIREGMQYVVGRENKRLKFEEAVKLKGEGSLEPLWADVPMRWNSTYLMLARALKYQYAFEYVMTDDEYTGWHLTAEEWSLVEKVCKLLEPLYKIADLFLGTHHPTANLYYFNVWSIGLRLMEALEDNTLEISCLAQKLKTEFDAYWDAYGNVLALAMIFDPRYKLDFIRFSYQKLDKTSAEDRYSSTCIRLETLFIAQIEQRFLSPAHESDDMREFEEWSRGQGRDSNKSYLNMYLNEARLDPSQQLDVLAWWKDHEFRLGKDLCLLARNMLSIPITSFPKDSTFGMGYRVQDRLEGVWSSNGTEALVAARNWLYGYEVNHGFPHPLMGSEKRFWKSNAANNSDDADSD